MISTLLSLALIAAPVSTSTAACELDTPRECRLYAAWTRCQLARDLALSDVRGLEALLAARTATAAPILESAPEPPYAQPWAWAAGAGGVALGLVLGAVLSR